MVAAEHSSKPRLLGVGLYTQAEASRILEMSPQRVARWAKGYSYLTEKGLKETAPYFERDFRRYLKQTIFTFADLIEMRFVDWFISQGVKRPTIRAAHENLSKRYKTTHPFVYRRVKTDGTNLYDLIGGEGDKALYQDAKTWQLVMTVIAEPFFKRLEYDKDIAVRYWPLGMDRRVVIDPERAFGKPIERKSGIPTYVMWGMAKAGETADAISDWYEVEPEGVADALEYEASLAA